MTTYRSPVYVFSIADQVGAVAANNFVTLMNPAGSGRVLALGGIFISSYSVGAATSTEPLRGHRITSSTGGTLAASTDVSKFSPGFPDAVAECRFGNPTIGGLGAAFFNSPPPIGTGAGTAFVHSVEAPPGAGVFVIPPGFGVVVRTAAGDIDQHFNISLAWAEVRP